MCMYVCIRGVGTPRYLPPPTASVQWQPDGFAIRADKRFLGAGLPGGPPIYLGASRWQSHGGPRTAHVSTRLESHSSRASERVRTIACSPKGHKYRTCCHVYV